jgi:hypothetical protein
MHATQPFPIEREGQAGWAHDEGHPAGYFHTWDALDLGAAFGPRRVHVFLPRDLDPNRRYPTIYVHDGDTAFFPGGVAGKSWDIAGTLSKRPVPPCIVVAIHPVDRNAEYTHVDWHHGTAPYGRVAEHTADLADRFKAFIDRNYPTDPSPQATAIVGSSHGGLAAFYAATRRPDAFGFAGCLSPSFFSGLDSLRHGVGRASLASAPLVTEVASVLADPARRPRVWIDWGERRDGGEHNSVVEALAAHRGAEMASLLSMSFDYVEGRDLFVHSDPIGGHDEDAWAWRFGLVAAVFLRPRS